MPVITDLSGMRAGYIPAMISELEQGVTDTYIALRDRTIGSGDPEGAASFDTSDPVQAFLANAVALLGADGELGPVIEFLVATSSILAGDDPLAGLQAFIQESYQDELRDGLAEELAQVTPEDFEDSSYIAQARAEAAAVQPVELTPEEQAASAGMTVSSYDVICMLDWSRAASCSPASATAGPVTQLIWRNVL